MARKPSRAPERVQQNAKELRRRQTRAEEVLWEALGNRQLQGLKFQRQRPMGGFIVDFYCAVARLVVEVDGPIHEFLTERDEDRQAAIESRGLRVIRFHNNRVLRDIDAVLAEIAEAALFGHP